MNCGQIDKIKAKISISRNSRDEVHVTITDETSGIQFVDAQLSLEDYAWVVTGLSLVNCTAEVRGLQYVGKKLVRLDRSIICPLSMYDRKELVKWLEDNCQEEGWILDTYLGTQKSIRSLPPPQEGCLLNYSIYKYVDVPIV